MKHNMIQRAIGTLDHSLRGDMKPVPSLLEILATSNAIGCGDLHQLVPVTEKSMRFRRWDYSREDWVVKTGNLVVESVTSGYNEEVAECTEEQYSQIGDERADRCEILAEYAAELAGGADDVKNFNRAGHFKRKENELLAQAKHYREGEFVPDEVLGGTLYRLDTWNIDSEAAMMVPGLGVIEDPDGVEWLGLTTVGMDMSPAIPAYWALADECVPMDDINQLTGQSLEWMQSVIGLDLTDKVMEVLGVTEAWMNNPFRKARTDGLC